MAWPKYDMITETRATTVARQLFPEASPVEDCKAEIGREGQPCRICAAHNAEWSAIVTRTREAMLKAFS